MMTIEMDYLPVMLDDCNTLRKAFARLRKAIDTKDRTKADSALAESVIPFHRMLNILFPTLGKADTLIATPTPGFGAKRANPFFADREAKPPAECRMMFVDLFLDIYRCYMKTIRQVLNDFDVADGAECLNAITHCEHLPELLTSERYSILEVGRAE
jgi:hypothetical protein